MLTFLGARICLGSMVEMLVLYSDVMPVQNSWWLAWYWKVGMKGPPKNCLRALECVQLRSARTTVFLWKFLFSLWSFPHSYQCYVGNTVQSKPSLDLYPFLALLFPEHSQNSPWPNTLHVAWNRTLFLIFKTVSSSCTSDVLSPTFCVENRRVLCVSGSQSVRDMMDGHSSDSCVVSGYLLIRRKGWILVVDGNKWEHWVDHVLQHNAK